MAESVEFDVSGADGLEKIFEQLPQKFNDKIMINTFRKASKPLISSIRKSVPKGTGETRKAVGFVGNKRKKGVPRVSVGIRGNKKWHFGYMKAYWRSYGTGASRDSSHSFKRKRKSISAKWKGGLKPENIVEPAWQANQKNVEGSIESEMKSETVKLLNKHAVK